MSSESCIRTLRTVTAVLTLTVSLAACTTGPDYARPTLHPPLQYKSATDADGEGDVVPRDWWKLFGDPELDRLVEEALNNNHDVRAAVARVAQARASAVSVKSAYYPVVTMSPSATRTRHAGADSASSSSKLQELSQTVSKIQQVAGVLQQGSTGTGVSGSTASQWLSILSGSTGASSSSAVETVTNSYMIPFDLSYEIDIWGKVRRSIESAEAQVKASEYDVEVIRHTLLADLARDYFDLRSFDAQAAILTRNLALYEEQVQLTGQKFTAGLAGESDHLQAKVQLETARADLEDILRQRADVEHAMAILLGRAPADFSLGARPLDVLPPTVPAGMPGDLLRRRPDVAEAEQNLVAACAEIGVAKAEFFPSVRLTGSAGFESSDFKNLLDWSNRVWSLGPSVSLPLFEGGKLRANLRKAKARFDELDAVYRGTVLSAFGEVEDALTDLHRRANQAEAQGRALDAAREYHHLARIEYDTGVIDYLQLVDAEQALLTNELAAARILNERMTSTVLLIKAIGGGWDSGIETALTQAP